MFINTGLKIQFKEYADKNKDEINRKRRERRQKNLELYREKDRLIRQQRRLKKK